MLLRFTFVIGIATGSIATIGNVEARITTIARTSDTAAGIPTAQWEDLQWATINNSGRATLRGTLATDGVEVLSTNDTGVWMFDHRGGTMIAREGAAMVPDIAGADFDQFNQVNINDDNEIWVGASLVEGVGGIGANSLGFWQYSDVDSRLVARTAAGNVAGIPNASYQTFSIGNVGAMSVAPRTYMAYVGSLTPGLGGVTSNTDAGVWSHTATTSTLIAREGVGNVPDIFGANFNFFAQPSINGQQQVAFLASLKIQGAVNTTNAAGIWRYSGTTGTLLARAGSGDVPGVAGIDFFRFDAYAVNESGSVLVRGALSDGSEGAWLYGDPGGTLLARTGTLGVPEVPGANFQSISGTTLNDADQVLIRAQLEPGPGGVTVDNHWGLWLMDDNPSMVARRGSGNVPDVPGASFSHFGEQALNNRGQIAFTADLEIGPGAIDHNNNVGLWIIDPEGDSLLVARKGDQLAGQTITALSFQPDYGDRPGGFNDHGQLVFRADFDNGDSGMFLYNPLDADFNWDGAVDRMDLTEWSTAWGETTGGDTDADGDTDGADFLGWQREFGTGTPLLPMTITVPEPAGCLLLLLGWLLNSPGIFHRHKQFKRYNWD